MVCEHLDAIPPSCLTHRDFGVREQVFRLAVQFGIEQSAIPIEADNAASRSPKVTGVDSERRSASAS